MSKISVAVSTFPFFHFFSAEFCRTKLQADNFSFVL